MNTSPLDLRELNRLWRRTLYSRILNLFEYENMPEEINMRAFKLGLWFFGKMIFYKIGAKYLVQHFSYTDKLDWYYIPKNGRVVNPWLPEGHQNYTFEVDKEAVIWSTTPDMYTFKQYSLVSDLVYKTASQLAENDISFYCVQRNSRLIAIFTAENDLEKAECNKILEKMYRGDTDITMQEDLVSHITANPISENSQRGRITELIEFQQYILANFYHAFGINSNYNLKREQLNSSEIDVNKDVLRLNIEDMLKCRELGVSKINDIYGLSVRVSLNEEVYKTLLQDAEMLENGNVSGIHRNENVKEAQVGIQAPENTAQTGESEDENQSTVKSVGDMSGRSNFENNGEQDRELENDNESGEVTPESNESGDIQVSVKVDVSAEVDDRSNLNTKGDDTDDNADTENNSEKVEE